MDTFRRTSRILICLVCKSSSQFVLFEEDCSDVKQGIVESNKTDGIVNKLLSFEDKKFSNQENSAEDVDSVDY